MNFGKSVQQIEETKREVRFSDVAGAEEEKAGLLEVVNS